MTTHNSLKTSITGLVKIAEQFVDAVDTQKSLSPDEAYDQIESIVAALEEVLAGIPTTEAPVEEKQETPRPEQPQDNEQIASLKAQVDKLTVQLYAKDREDIAEQISSYYPSVEADKVFNDIVKSQDSIEVLNARLETIAQFAKSNDIGPRMASGSSFVSLSRTAKQVENTDNQRPYII